MYRATMSVAFLFLLAVIGCGSSGPVMHEVRGRVTMSGKELPGAQVQFVPDQKGIDPVTGICGEDGMYRVLVPAGDHTVRILAQKLVPARKGMTGPYGVQIEKMTVDVVPPRYNAKSELRVSVQAPLEKDFDLEPR